VRLATTNWRDEPTVEFNLLSDKRDLDRLCQGFRKIAALHGNPAMQAVTSDVFPASYSDKVRQVGVVNKKNKFMTNLMSKMLDGPAALRQMLIRKFIMEGFTLEQMMTDDDALEAFVRKAAVGVWHASCTCRMGSDDDPMAVTDITGRVRGVEGLRVVDASIFPVVPCANTNFPTLMTAEKISDAVLNEQ
jgi:5-(hydroxymethyl)furfural/furfural oxidase